MITVQGGVQVFQLVKPPHNGLDATLAESIETALDEAVQRRCTVLHLRTDEPSFCAGTDIARLVAWVEQGVDALDADAARFDALFRRMESAPLVVVAEIGGPALGAGLGLALACDLRIATAEARFGVPEAKVGMLPPGGTIGRLARLAGHQAARRLLLTAELVDGTEALRLGLVDRIVPQAELATAAASLAARVASLSPGALRAAKIALAEVASITGEVATLRELAGSPPDRERFAAFVGRLSGAQKLSPEPDFHTKAVQ